MREFCRYILRTKIIEHGIHDRGLTDSNFPGNDDETVSIRQRKLYVRDRARMLRRHEQKPRIRGKIKWPASQLEMFLVHFYKLLFLKGAALAPAYAKVGEKSILICINFLTRIGRYVAPAATAGRLPAPQIAVRQIFDAGLVDASLASMIPAAAPELKPDPAREALRNYLFNNNPAGMPRFARHGFTKV